MDWRKHIHSDPDILLGKPVIRGTRISVELILEALAAGESIEDIIDSYPRLREEDVRAVIALEAERRPRPRSLGIGASGTSDTARQAGESRNRAFLGGPHP